MDEINERIFSFLEGDWSVRRQFEGSYKGAFSGEASFVAEAGKHRAYRYVEEGKLADNEGKTFDAKQSYLYQLTEGQLQVFKREESDWSLMHDLEFVMEDNIAVATHVHLCGQDHYAATYRINFDTDSWEVNYTVSGPKKDYRIWSTYER